MALAQQVSSNSPDIISDLNVVLGCKYTKIQYNLSIRENIFQSQGMSGQMVGFHNGAPSVDLDLKFYIDQSALLSKEDLFTSIENKLCEMLTTVDGVFTQRSVQPFGETKAITVGYSVKLSDYDNFVSKLNKMARTKTDREFTKVLEAKLTED